tara:strand:- start:1846 stop:2799 length:954 start_codon:yes stop_codon:yes gene_type:complete
LKVVEHLQNCRNAGALCFLAILLVFAFAADAARAEQSGAKAHTRIISIGGSITEIIYALGAADGLIAVDTTSRYPLAATRLPNVGYMRQLAIEPILALNPTIVLAESDAGPPTVLKQLRAAGVMLRIIPDNPSPQGVVDKIRSVASALGTESKSEALISHLESEFSRLENRALTAKKRPAVLFLLSVGSGTPLAAGRETSAARIIELAGGRNAIEAFEGFKPLSPEAIAAANPDVILVTERTRKRFGGADGVMRRPEIAVTPAGQKGHLVTMDGLLLLGFGPRTPTAIEMLAAALHPSPADDLNVALENAQYSSIEP